MGFGVCFYLLRLEGSAVDGEREHYNEGQGDEPIGRDCIEEHANDGAEEEHVESVTV